MDSSKTGLSLLEKGDASGALIAFTKALIEHPTSPDYYINRAKAFARLSPPRHDLALQDAEIAILFAQQRGSRQKMQEGQLRRVVAMYNYGQFMSAQKLLTFSSKWGNTQMFAMWKAKVEQKLNTLPEDQKVETEIDEIPNISVPSADQAKARRKKELNADGSFNFDVAEGKESPADAPRETSDVPIPGEKPNTAPSGPISIRQDWFQTATNITITLFAKGVDKDRFTADIQDDSLHISFPNSGSPDSEYSFSVDPFYALIDASASKANVLKTKIEVILVKATPNQKWASLEGTEPLDKSDASRTKTSIPQHVLQKDTAPVYPTSSKTGAKNWDKLAADLSAKPKKKRKEKVPKDNENGSASESEENEPDYDSDMGGDEVDGFFKKLYAGSDPDTQRAMMKSYYESGGSTLSTNWEEVSKGPVKPYESKDD